MHELKGTPGANLCYWNTGGKCVHPAVIATTRQSADDDKQSTTPECPWDVFDAPRCAHYKEVASWTRKDTGSKGGK